MSASVRSQLVAALAARLAPLGNVAPWRKTPWRLEDLPAISFRDGVAKEAGGIIGRPPRWRLRVALCGYLGGATPAATAREMLSDMLAAIGTDPRFGGLANWTDPVRSELMIRLVGDTLAAVRLNIDILYTSALIETTPADNILTAGGELLTAGGEPLTW